VSRYPIKVLPDGTRVYTNRTSYTPVPPEKRKYGVRKPADPRAVRFSGDWYLPLDVLPEEERVMPESTRSDRSAPWQRPTKGSMRSSKSS
jgi:hypothetical protein